MPRTMACKVSIYRKKVWCAIRMRRRGTLRPARRFPPHAGSYASKRFMMAKISTTKPPMTRIGASVMRRHENIA